MIILTCKECGQTFESDIPMDHPICDECAEELEQAEDDENELEL